MKDIMKYYLQLITLVFCLFVSACSDDDETTTRRCGAILNRRVNRPSLVQVVLANRLSPFILVMMLRN